MKEMAKFTVKICIVQGKQIDLLPVLWYN